MEKYFVETYKFQHKQTENDVNKNNINLKKIALSRSGVGNGGCYLKNNV